MYQPECQNEEHHLKYYRDLKNSLDTAEEKGFVKGKLEGKLETARNLKLAGMSIEFIQQMTGLSIDEIQYISLENEVKLQTKT